MTVENNHNIILSRNPTGGILHIHDSTVTPLEFLIANVSYRENLYICSSSGNDPLKFVFAPSTPADPTDPTDPTECYWELVSERRSREGAQKFDAFLLSRMSLYTDSPSGNRCHDSFDVHGEYSTTRPSHYGATLNYQLEDIFLPLSLRNAKEMITTPQLTLMAEIGWTRFRSTVQLCPATNSINYIIRFVVL